MINGSFLWSATDCQEVSSRGTDGPVAEIVPNSQPIFKSLANQQLPITLDRRIRSRASSRGSTTRSFAWRSGGTPVIFYIMKVRALQRGRLKMSGMTS